ncbi:unnamed protein product [Peronospora farinosa]|uniref:PTM/DIR17-like Tudor domain-containing protein n=1 Tax=Peronospora farinosa TaxID=134698 RepID=A0AAV0UNT2_9STRA|nr:unnamed protein product [Peronospora farinosa]CAI5738500.1 unnamed protein product [Peronospora farinosa]
MSVRPDTSVCASPDVAASPRGSDICSPPAEPVFVSRRRYESDGCSSNVSLIQNADTRSCDVQDEDSHSKPRHSSIRSQSPSSSTSSKTEDKVKSDDDQRRLKQSQWLPSLSPGSSALLQLREQQRSNNSSASSPSSSSSIRRSISTVDASTQNQLSSQNEANANGASFPTPLTSFHRRKEEGNPLIPDEDMTDEKDDMADDVGDKDPPTSPSPIDRRVVRIMFHEREIFAEDLIGLRVAKTFAGRGRFLGQVVKFDKRTALYTVVYADGDAENLTVDDTLQILIQDEIERADPSNLPPAVSLLFKTNKDGSSPPSPDTGDFMTRPAPRQCQSSTSQRRARIQISEREAQFVISLFENHALPALVRQGWRLLTSSSGKDKTRFVSATGEIFQSELDVVEHIALDNELLILCFPANVHSAILSLLPGEAGVSSTAFTGTSSRHGSTKIVPRKRTTSDSPSAGHFDSKRTRGTPDEAYGRVVVPMRAGVVRDSNIVHHRYNDMDRCTEDANRMSAYHRQGMGGRIRMSGDRFFGGETTNEARVQAPPELREYRRTSGRDRTLENPFSSKWSRTESVLDREEDARYCSRYVNTPGWRERDDVFAMDRDLEVHCYNRFRTESRYTHRLNSRISADADDGANGTANGTSTGFYRDLTESKACNQASPMANGFAYSQYSNLRAEVSTSNRTSAPPRVSRKTASFMSPTDNLGSTAAFSVVDFDRVSTKRPGNIHTE